MGWKTFLAVLFVIVAVGLFGFYEFFPLIDNSFEMKAPEETGFNIGIYNPENMQFYSNLRFPESVISYRIGQECTLQKRADIEEAFDIISNLTILNFYPVDSYEQILIGCKEREKIDESGLFVAGEGGPTKIIQTKNFNVILEGEILLLRDSECENPNVPIHELLHVLGFEHSTNPGSIMYNVSRCNQVISEDILRRINELYSVESYSDLSIEDASANVHGRYVDMNLTVRNNGLKDSAKSKIKIYVDDEILKELELEGIEIGFGRAIAFGNLYSPKREFQNITIVVETDFNELDKKNNEVVLEIKK